MEIVSLLEGRVSPEPLVRNVSTHVLSSTAHRMHRPMPGLVLFRSLGSATVMSDPQLGVEDRTGGSELDQDCDKDHDRSENDDPDQRHDDIENAPHHS